MSWNATYALLIAFSTLVTYLSGIFIYRMKTVNGRKMIVAISFIVNLSILFFYKYFNFFSETFAKVFDKFGMSIDAPVLDILLPVGISFYTFQALSYTMDVYRKEIEPERNIGIYALFVSYFPQLVAGPIERSKHLLPQLHNFSQLNYENLRAGFLLMLWGFFKKIVIADRIAVLVNTVYDDPGKYTGIETFAAVLLFSFQIFCDFSAYTDIARGVARLMGIDLMKNFDSPYFSKNITEFWRRWHISLSTWFRDYLYIPLGGSRKGKERTYFNLFFVFLVSGLWHGASMNFVIWGAMHGVLIVLEKIYYKRTSWFFSIKRDASLSIKLFRGLFTFTLVTFLWIFFRADTFSDSLIVIQNLFNWDMSRVFNGELYKLGLTSGQIWLSVFFIGIMLLVEYYNSFVANPISLLLKQHIVFRWSVYLILILTTLIFGAYGGEQQQFIYFQF
ncbi:MBOAT family O-acyltransferase [Leeuwenhoekiella sp.]|uniref:MBOAT family O-acyltransferase n=1 Tax=Leeuwenhoekiella sp. TaxID=1977054 RepID=UPI0025C57110|nr:MBOAT family O-acyltransferase [Leeuwenhoekiella sp.]|tara:strand:+ start:127199 stop:128539 length:1341 start_codon:yes stop_codon:yes gene_type:complete